MARTDKKIEGKERAEQIKSGLENAEMVKQEKGRTRKNRTQKEWEKLRAGQGG